MRKKYRPFLIVYLKENSDKQILKFLHNSNHNLLRKVYTIFAKTESLEIQWKLTITE